MRGTRGARTAIVAGSLLASGGCKEPAQAPRPVGNEVARVDRSTTLWRDAVTATDYVRSAYYTWTTLDQIANLRRDRRLLVREESPTHGASYFEQVIHALAGTGDAIATLLDTTTFAKSRFAWPSPWATREGWADEQYGDQLVRVTLKPEAIIIAVATPFGVVEARDQRGLVATSEVLAHPERIGAVYFVSDGSRPVANRLPAATATYREFVLCNESMIASWSVGTQDTVDELNAETAALKALAAELEARPPTTKLARDYATAVALSNSAYRLAPDALNAIARHLQATPRPPAVEGGGDATFPGLGPARTPPRVVAPRSNTFARGTY